MQKVLKVKSIRNRRFKCFVLIVAVRCIMVVVSAVGIVTLER